MPGGINVTPLGPALPPALALEGKLNAAGLPGTGRVAAGSVGIPVGGAWLLTGGGGGGAVWADADTGTSNEAPIANAESAAATETRPRRNPRREPDMMLLF